MNPLVTIVIPIRNGEKTLAACLDSLLLQDYENFEIIAVDNGSGDKTREILESYAKKTNKIKYVYEEIKSRGRARNKGTQCAKGEAVLFIDCDCIAPEDWIRALSKPILEEDEVAVMGGVEDLKQTFWTKKIHEINQRYFESMRDGKYINCLCSTSMALKKDLALKLPFDETLVRMQDYELSLRIREKNKILYMPSPRVKHWYRDTASAWIKANFQQGYYAYKIGEKYKKNPLFERDRHLDTLTLYVFSRRVFWAIIQFIKRPTKETYADIISELSWKAGIMWAKR